jgi:hypothetical protein
MSDQYAELSSIVCVRPRYGSFGFDTTIKYPLDDRGVVLVVGRNDDDTSVTNFAQFPSFCPPCRAAFLISSVLAY